MSRRVQSVTAFFGLVLCAGVAMYGCAEEDEPFLPTSPSGTGGVTNTTVTPGLGDSTYAVTPVVGTGGSGPVVGAGGTPPAGAGGTPTGVSTPVAGTGGVKPASTPVVATTGGTSTKTTAIISTGGKPPATTTAATTNTGTTVTFAKGKGVGAMTGYGYVALAADDSVSSPTCGTDEITAAASCASGTTWAADDSLCVSGSIPALPAEPVPDAAYASNWGISVGLNASETEGEGLGQSFSSVKITVTGAPTAGLRATVHLKGDPEKTSYCAALTSGTAIAFTKFATDCWNTVPEGSVIAKDDVPNIDKINVQVSSESEKAKTVKDLCITGITFAK